MMKDTLEAVCQFVIFSFGRVTDQLNCYKSIRSVDSS